MNDSNCDCWKRPFEPPKGCFEKCTAKILKYARAHELVTYLGIGSDLANNIAQRTSDDGFEGLSGFRTELGAVDYRILEEAFKNISEKGWKYISTTIRARIKENED